MTTAKEPERTGTTRVYRGYLRLVRHSSSTGDKDPTFLQALGTACDDECPEDDDGSLAGQLALAVGRYGRRVRLRFAAGADRHSVDPDDPLGTGWAEARGLLDASSSLVAGTRPGAWLVREKITVAGRDLLKALKALEGKFCHLEVTYTPQAEGDKS